MLWMRGGGKTKTETKIGRGFAPPERVDKN
jgi:hypothetical protein